MRSAFILQSFLLLTLLALFVGLGFLADGTSITGAVVFTQDFSQGNLSFWSEHVSDFSQGSFVSTAVYNTSGIVLSKEVDAIYTATFETNQSGNLSNEGVYSIVGVNQSQPTWNATGGVNASGAYHFDSLANQYYDIEESSLLDVTTDEGNITLSAWVYPLSLHGNQGVFVMGNTVSSAAKYRKWSIEFSGGGYDDFYFQHGNGGFSGSDGEFVRCQNVLSVNSWQHLAARRVYYNSSSTNVTLFYNGAPCTSKISPFNTSANSNVGTYLGSQSSATGYFNGTIDEVHFWGRGLSSSEIAALANGSNHARIYQEQGNWTSPLYNASNRTLGLYEATLLEVNVSGNTTGLSLFARASQNASNLSLTPFVSSTKNEDSYSFSGVDGTYSELRFVFAGTSIEGARIVNYTASYDVANIANLSNTQLLPENPTTANTLVGNVTYLLTGEQNGSILIRWYENDINIYNHTITDVSHQEELTFSYNQTLVASRNYSFVALAISQSLVEGQEMSSATRDVVSADSTFPLVSISAPSNASSLRGVFSVEASVIDAMSVQAFVNITNSSGSQAFSTMSNTSASSWNTSITSNTFSDGWYTLIVVANDSSGNRNASELVSVLFDNSNPTLSDVSSSTDSSSALVVWNTSEAVSARVSYGLTLSLNESVLNSTTSTNPWILLSDLNQTALYYYNVTSCDVAGNCQENGPYNFTTTTASTSLSTGSVSSSGSSSGGSGSSASTGVSGQFSKQFFGALVAGELSSFAVTDQNLAVEHVSFTSQETLYGAWMQISHVSDAPHTLNDDLHAYTYFELTKNDRVLHSDVVDEYAIRFRVTQDWLTEQGASVNGVVLLRLVDGEWQELSTSHVSTQDGLALFEAVTPGFSYFAIAARSSEESHEALQASPQEVGSLEQESSGPKKVVLGGILSLGGLVGLVFMGMMLNQRTRIALLERLRRKK